MLNSSIIQLIIALAPYGIDLVKEVIKVAHKEDPTLEDWLAAFDKAKEPFHSASFDPSVLVADKVKPPGGTTVTVTTEPTAPKTP